MKGKKDSFSTILIISTGTEAFPYVGQIKEKMPENRVVACSSDNVMDVLRDCSPGIVLLYVTEEDSSTAAVIEEIKKQIKPGLVPLVIFCKGKKEKNFRTRLLESGALAVFEGPFDEDWLVLQVKALARVMKKTLSFDLLKKKYDYTKSELDQRVKELECLYGIAAIRERPGTKLEEILQGIVNLIPPACQHPEITCARISIGYQEFRSPNFKITPWKHSCDIQIYGEWGGTIELVYLEEPEKERGFFLNREANLLKVIGERIGRIAERVIAEESLHIESQTIINILKSMEDMVCKITDKYEISYINPSFEKEFGLVNNRTCYEYFNNLDKPCPTCRLEQVLSGNTVHREWNFPWTGKTYDIIETPLRETDGTVSKLSIIRDLTDIKRTQKELKERELLYRSLTESVADGVVLVQRGKILFVNRAFVEMLHYSNPQEIITKNIAELFDDDYTDTAKKIFDTEYQSHDQDFIPWLVCITKDAKKIWVSVNRSIIRLKSRPAILATIRDVTNQVIWERSMQEETEQLRKENIKLKTSIKERYKFGSLIGKSPVMQEVYELILKAAATDANVLVLGESGTGKDLVARAIHEMSDRDKKPFVAVNCGAIPEQIAESEFFGHRKGSFTGAYSDKKGYLYAANGGTLFLDEVGELSLNMQVKFLRALENGEYTPVGDTRPRRSDFRVIAATNRNFSKMVSEGKIREDFYYRISVIPIVVAPLRERKEDIPLLVEHFLRLYTKDKKVVSMPARHMDILLNYSWPGNVRELQSTLQRYLAVGNLDFLNCEGASLTENEIHSTSHAMVDIELGDTDLKTAVQAFEKQVILKTLNKYRWHRGKVASALGLNPKTLYIKMKKTGLS